MSVKNPKKPYVEGLDKHTRERYAEKIGLIGGVDPYELTKKEMKTDVACLPAITYIDILNYLVNTKSAYTMNELKAYKSLESYNQFVCGWVRDVLSFRSSNDKILVTGRVRHSQRMNDTALKPWVIADTSGVVEAAHCDCMAGLGEACSHVGAILFYIEAAARISSSKTVTQEKAYWLLPTSVDKVPYTEISDIDFTSAETKKRRLDSAIDGEPDTEPRSTMKLPPVPEPTAAERDALMESLFLGKSKASVLTVSAKYQKNFMPALMQDGQLPDPFVSLKDEKYVEMGSSELREECKKLFETIKVSENQSKNVEIVTRDQSKCKEWHRLRMGRITASNMKAVCTTSLDAPAISTVRAVCDPVKFKNKATTYGCKHEQDALQAYTSAMAGKHENFSVSRCGLFISPDYPFIGATPDGLVTCSCCGDGVVEVKCPYSAKDQFLKEVNFDFLENHKLKKTNKYAYQVQTQLTVTDRDYCDFVVWTAKDFSVERITPDAILENEILDKSKNFFLHVVLPEMTGNLISRERILQQQQTTTSDNILQPSSSSSEPKSPQSASITDGELRCICNKVCTSDCKQSVKCENENCRYGMLHYGCVNLKRKPKKPYYCPKCRQTSWK